jgi:hypothetical protein
MNRYPAYTLALLAALPLPPVQAAPVATASGSEISVSLGSYRYEEPGLMSLQGMKSGLNLQTTTAWPERRTFLRGELRVAAGRVDYHSNDTGSHDQEPDWYVEGRALIGNDWPQADSLLSTYTGLGYRYLMNDGRGPTTTGHAGYRRESNYLYLPLGIILQRAWLQGTLRTRIEYDHLLNGNQFTQLSDTGLGYTDVNSKQSTGHGLKLQLSYVTGEWFAGPYLHHWDIADSAEMPLYRNGSFVGYGVEPQNRTTEIGFEFGRPF